MSKRRRGHAHRNHPGDPRGHQAGNQLGHAEEKAALIKGASQLLLDVLNKPLESTFVVIEEVDTDNWGWGGLPALEYRRRRAAAATASSGPEQTERART